MLFRSQNPKTPKPLHEISKLIYNFLQPLMSKDPKMDPELQKKYGAYKVSEFTHGKDGYKFESPSAEPEKFNDRTVSPDDQFLQNMENQDVDYRKRYTLKERKETFKKEFRSASDVFKEFSPFRLTKQMNYIKNLTPEEYETVLMVLDDLKCNTVIYSALFLSLTSGFTYWQRMYLPRGFWFFTGFFGIFSGVFMGTIKSGYFGIEQLDKLGKEYELSRLIKQDIFDTRPDVDADIRALYYMKQNKMNEEIEEKMKKGIR